MRAKALRQFDETFNDPQQLGVAISESIATGDWRLFFLQRDQWRKLTPADVQRVALDYLKPANRTLGQFIPDAKPDRAPTPPAADIAAMVKDYKGDPGVAAGESFEPTPANLEARTQRFALPNGMKVALLPKKTRGETVQIADAPAPGRRDVAEGHVAARQPRRVDAGARHEEARPAGVRGRARPAPREALDRRRRDGDRRCAARRCARTCPTLLRLTAEALREPAFPADRVREAEARAAGGARGAARPIRRPSRSARSSAGTIPIPRATSATRRRSTRRSRRSRRAKLDDVKRFYARFVGGAHAELAIVGDFDPAAMRALVTELFGAWKSPSPFARVPQSVPAAGADGADGADARQGERGDVRPRCRSRSTIAATTCRR